MAVIDWTYFHKDIKSTSDITIKNNDVVVTNSAPENLIMYINERFKSNKQDLAFLPNYGADLDSLVGKGIDQSLINSLSFKLKYALTYDGLLNSSDIRIACISKINYVDVYLGVKYNNEEITVKAIYYNDGSINIEQ